MYNKQITIEGAGWGVSLDRGDVVLDNAMFNQGFAGQDGSKKAAQPESQIKEEVKVPEVENIESNTETAEEPAKLDDIEEPIVEQAEQVVVEEVIHKKRGRKPKTIITESDENNIEGEENELQNDTDIHEG